MLHSLITLDERVFTFFHSWFGFAPNLWMALAVYGVYLVPFVLLWVWFARRRETSLLAFIAGVLAWQVVARIISDLVDRRRPVDVLHISVSSHEGFFHRPGSSFPSDHTSFMTALVVILWVAGYRGAAWVVLVLELITVLSRVVVGFHWPGDILGGMLIGAATAGVIWLFRRPVERWVVQPLVGVARKIGL